MRELHRFVAFIGMLGLVVFSIAGCNQRQSSPANASTMSWTNLFHTSRSVILNGSWEQAENRWAELKNEGRSADHLKDWIELQVDILQKTQSDPLKEELRLGAIQEMYFETEASRQHLSWLKKSVESGFFKEARVEQKAKQLVQELHAGRVTGE